jgi:hypothetical protein
MAKINNIHSFVVAAEEANLTTQRYTEIIGGAIGCTITINGVEVEVGPQSNILISVRTLSGGVGCYLGGENIDVYLGSQYLNNSVTYGNDIDNDYIDNYVDDYFN